MALVQCTCTSGLINEPANRIWRQEGWEGGGGGAGGARKRGMRIAHQYRAGKLQATESSIFILVGG